MKSLWNDADAAQYVGDDLAIRVHTSRLLGADESLVMHGGGNTSVKSTMPDFFGREVEVLYVKGSGWDLATIEKEGFSPMRLSETKMLADLDSLPDAVMAKQLRAFLMDQASPTPSVEAILHAIIPTKFVDHTHTDAVVTLSNTPRGPATIAELYPDCLVLPYVMPGFQLSKQVYEAIKGQGVSQYRGIILLHHGVFTFADDARTAYENMIELVDRAEKHIATLTGQSGQEDSCVVQAAGTAPDLSTGSQPDLLRLAKIRKAVSLARGAPQLASLNATPAAIAFASRPDVASLATRGPITPDHVIRTKRTAVILPEIAADEVPEVQTFVEEYERYFKEFNDGNVAALDPAPRWAVWEKTGTLAFGTTKKQCDIVTDITRHTAWAIQTGELLGGWRSLPAKDIFELEYWSLEQAKLKKPPGPPQPHLGKIAIVTGAAGGIGRAVAERLRDDGAVVVGLDIKPEIVANLDQRGISGRVCDLTDSDSIRSQIDSVVFEYGGLDILVLNAGIFESGETIDQLEENWDRSIAVNLTASQRVLKHAIGYLKVGLSPSVVVIGSRNVTAPGAGAAAYSVAKAGLTQLARVAALELAQHGVRVNVIHPDAVFDTDLWTQETLERSAARYGLTVEQYRTRNLLGVEIKAVDVARLASTVASDIFRATTGSQIPIDGGSDRVI